MGANKEVVVGKAQRCVSFDTLKIICAFLVVCIHCPLPGIVGEYSGSVTRVAVPIFFMITGFFYEATKRRGNKYKQIKKILGLVIGTNVLYLLYDLCSAYLRGEGIAHYIASTCNREALRTFILFNQSPFGGHLWYLSAIFYTLVIMLVVESFHMEKLIYIMIPLLLIVDLVFGKYSLLIIGKEFPYYMVRNFLFVGIPYFCIGNLLKQYEGMIKEKFNKGYLLIGGMVCFVATGLLERSILVTMQMNATRDHYISTTFLAVTVFIYAMCHTQLGAHTFLPRAGKNYSSTIYIIHLLFIGSVGLIMQHLGLGKVFECIGPLIIFVCAYTFAVIYHRIKSKIRAIKVGKFTYSNS